MVGMRTQKRTGREMRERSRGGGGLWVGSVVAVGGGLPGRRQQVMELLVWKSEREGGGDRGSGGWLWGECWT